MNQTIAKAEAWEKSGYPPAGLRALIAYTATLAEEHEAAGEAFSRWAMLASLVNGFTLGWWRPERLDCRRNELQVRLLAGDLDGAMAIHRRMRGYEAEGRAKRDQQQITEGLERVLAAVAEEPGIRELIEKTKVPQEAQQA